MALKALTIEELVGLNLITKEDGELIYHLIEQRNALTIREREIDNDKKEVNTLIIDLSDKVGIASFCDEILGSITVGESSRTTLSQDLIKKGLLAKGWMVEEIVDFLTNCSTTSVGKKSVTFRSVKEKGEAANG